MGRVKPRKLKSEDDKESSIARALEGLHSGLYPSIRKAANITGVAYSTLRRRFHGAQSRVAAHEAQQLMTAAEERAIVRWIYRLELAGFSPRIEHVRQAVMILKDEPEDLDKVIGKNWITRFLNRHPDLVAKFSSSLDPSRVKPSDPEIPTDPETPTDPEILTEHLWKLGGLVRKYNIPENMWFNMDAKGGASAKI